LSAKFDPKLLRARWVRVGTELEQFVALAVERPAISQIQTDRQLLLLEKFALQCLYSASLLHVYNCID